VGLRVSESSAARYLKLLSDCGYLRLDERGDAGSGMAHVWTPVLDTAVEAAPVPELGWGRHDVFAAGIFSPADVLVYCQLASGKPKKRLTKGNYHKHTTNLSWGRMSASLARWAYVEAASWSNGGWSPKFHLAGFRRALDWHARIIGCVGAQDDQTRLANWKSSSYQGLVEARDAGDSALKRAVAERAAFHRTRRRAAAERLRLVSGQAKFLRGFAASPTEAQRAVKRRRVAVNKKRRWQEYYARVRFRESRGWWPATADLTSAA